jgi:hypothetical protein
MVPGLKIISLFRRINKKNDYFLFVLVLRHVFILRYLKWCGKLKQLPTVNTLANVGHRYVPLKQIILYIFFVFKLLSLKGKVLCSRSHVWSVKLLFRFRLNLLLCFHSFHIKGYRRLQLLSVSVNQVQRQAHKLTFRYMLEVIQYAYLNKNTNFLWWWVKGLKWDAVSLPYRSIKHTFIYDVQSTVIRPY